MTEVGKIELEMKIIHQPVYPPSAAILYNLISMSALLANHFDLSGEFMQISKTQKRIKFGRKSQASSCFP